MGLVVPLVTLPYLARVLRPEGWGLVIFSQSFGAWLVVLLEYAFDLSGTRAIARARAEPHQIGRIVTGVQGAKLLVLLAVTCAIGATYLLVPLFRDNPPYLLWAGAFALAKGFSPLWYFLGVERMRAPVNVEVAGRVVAAAGVFVFVHAPEDGWIVLALQAGGSAASTLLLTLWLYRQVPARWPPLTLAAGTLRESVSIFVLRASSGAYIQANAFVLGLLTTQQVVGIFGGAERIIRAAVNLLNPISQAILPRLSNLVVTDPAKAKQLLRVALITTVGFGTVMGMTAALGAGPLVRVLLGPGYDAAVPVLRVLALLPPVIAVGTVFGIQWALPMQLDRPFTALVLLAGALNIALAVALAPRLGALGMAISVVAADVLVSAGLVVLFVRTPGPTAP